jgi:carboxyl-terminal processing protease
LAKSPLGRCEIPGRRGGTRTTRPPEDGVRECKLPLDSVTRQDVVKVRFSAEGGEPPLDAELRPTVAQLDQPDFAYSYQVADNRPGNGDGQIARGEGVSIYLDIKNVGKGRSYETQALLRNLTGDGLLLRAGRFDVSDMEPGEVRTVVFTFDVLDVLRDNLVKLEVSIVDHDLRVVSSEKLTLPLASANLAVATRQGAVQTKAQTAVRGQPSDVAPVVGRIAAGSRLAVTGELNGFARVQLGEERFGYVALSDVGDANAPGSFKLEPLLTRSPPLLEVSPATLATRSDTVRISGTARDADQVRDAYVFVGSRKVYYKSNRKSTDPKTLPFSFEAKLDPGMNVITVVARENEDTATSQTLAVRRDGPSGEALATPSRDVFGADWDFSDSP